MTTVPVMLAGVRIVGQVIWHSLDLFFESTQTKGNKMFVVITVLEAMKHVGEFAHIQTAEGKHICKGKLALREEEAALVIEFTEKPANINEPSFQHIHSKLLGDSKIMLWAAPGEPDYGILEPVKQEDPSGQGNSQTQSNDGAQSLDSGNSGTQGGEDLSGEQAAEESATTASEDVSSSEQVAEPTIESEDPTTEQQ